MTYKLLEQAFVRPDVCLFEEKKIEDLIEK